METINLEQIKNQVAKKHGFKAWKDVGVIYRYIYTDEIAEYYAQQCCDEQIKACCENAKIHEDWNADYTQCNYYVDEDSILSTPNVVKP